MKLPVRSLSAAALLLVSLSGCIVIPAHRYHGPPRTVIIDTDRGHPHGHRGGERRYDDRYDRHGPYRR